MKLSNQRKGELFIICGVFLWSLFPIFAQISYKNISPFTSLSISSVFASLYFAFLLFLRKRWFELKNKNVIKYALYSTFFTAFIFYLFYFLSLRYSSAGNVSIIALSESFFSFLLFHVWRKEFIPKVHIYGAALILSGAVIILAPSFQKFHIGDILILTASAIVPFGNFYLQKARKLASTEAIMFIRTLVGAVGIFILSLIFRSASPLVSIVEVLPFLIANGLLMLGLSSNFWVEGIHRIPVTKATAFNALGPLLTIFFAWVVFQTTPTVWQLISFIPMFFGVLLISKKA